jgi:hypothetical protein
MNNRLAVQGRSGTTPSAQGCDQSHNDVSSYKAGWAQTAQESRSSDVNVSPAVLIVALVAAFVLALVALLRARPEDIEKLVRLMTGWFSK